MGRRASSNINTTTVVVVIAIVGIIATVGIIVGVGAVLLKKNDSSFEGTPSLRVDEALNNGNSLRGNEYRVEGKLLARWPRDSGAMVEILVEDDGKSTNFPILVPPGVSNVNFEREQRYVFKVKFGNGGVAIASDVKRL